MVSEKYWKINTFFSNFTGNDVELHEVLFLSPDNGFYAVKNLLRQIKQNHITAFKLTIMNVSKLKFL